MEVSKKEWIKTEEMLEQLKNDPDVDHQYTHWLGGILRSTYFMMYDSHKDLFEVSMDWLEFEYYTESEFLECYSGHFWCLDV